MTELRTRAVCKLHKRLSFSSAACGGVNPALRGASPQAYGGDGSQKRKLLDKRKAGKKKMRQFGRVDIPQEAFINALKMDG